MKLAAAQYEPNCSEIIIGIIAQFVVLYHQGESHMKIQTKALMASLPHFASAIEGADRLGSSNWEIVRWQDTDPNDLIPGCEHSLTTEQITAIIDDSPPESRDF